jgi:gas vesicle protein
MERDNGSAVIWLVSGVAVGAAVALLLTPQKGDQTRKQLGKHMERGSKTLLESGRELFEQGREMYQRGREIADDAASMFERARSIAEKKINETI